LKTSIKNIVKQCLCALLLGSFSFVLAGEQTIKVGAGYKYFNAAFHNNKLHSGRYFSLGYGYSYGRKMNNHFQFQIANSNKEVNYELPYVSANTNLDISQEFNFPGYNKGKFTNYTGFYFNNSFDLNFFPIVDRKNIIWENHLVTGLSFRNQYKLNEKTSINLNIQLPVFSSALSYRLDRFDGALPHTNRSLWESMDKQLGFVDQLFKPNFEIGYVKNIVSTVKAGIFYQGRFNWYERQNGYRTKSNAHIISLRITY
jgi:hypothetical protein